ncbi:MAG: BMC domain-containing protein [Lachnospiraceae bacterium]|nr:BMC domain-containing protein [Lachnospiraceae bacterium]
MDKAKATGARQVRSVQVQTVAREISFAHVMGSPDDIVFSNLALDIGFHDSTHEGGARPEGSLGVLNIRPQESVVIAADLAVKSGAVDIGFMDRFSGTLIITGPRGDVIEAMRQILQFFSESLHFNVCPLALE